MSLDGDAKSSRILEMREILDEEKNIAEEASLESLTKKYPSLGLRIHDSVFACQFAEGIVTHRTLDRFHPGNHKRDVCRAKYKPGTPANYKMRYKFGRTNTAVCEQIFRKRNQQSTAKRMGRLSYRAFRRHFCLSYNAYVSGRRKGSLSLNQPATSRRNALGKTGRS